MLQLGLLRIDMEGITMTPIGSSEVNSFRGTFDGQGHVISNLVISGESNIGLFGYVTGGAYVKNFILDSSYSISGASYMMDLISENYSKQLLRRIPISGLV